VATTIKVDRLVLLDALTTKLAEQEKLQAQHDKAVADYEKAEKAWHEKVATACPKGLGGDTDELRKTIRLLSMTTEPNVPASVYKSVSNWL